MSSRTIEAQVETIQGERPTPAQIEFINRIAHQVYTLVKDEALCSQAVSNRSEAVAYIVADGCRRNIEDYLLGLLR